MQKLLGVFIVTALLPLTAQTPVTLVAQTNDPRIVQAERSVAEAQLGFDRAELLRDKVKVALDAATAPAVTPDAKNAMQAALAEADALVRERKLALVQSKLALRGVELDVREAALKQPAVVAKKVYPRNLEELLPLAEQGDAEAQSRLGDVYRGHNNRSEAMKWYRKAAAQNDGWAETAIGWPYLMGIGMPANTAEAVKWFQLASDQGHPKGQSLMAAMYSSGWDGVVPKDTTIGDELHRKSFQGFAQRAEAGDDRAQYELAEAYSSGNGVARSHTEAAKWYRVSADQGNPQAQYQVAQAYEYGRGVPQSYTEAIRWYRQAADQGYVTAQYTLGHQYREGKGVPPSITEAVKWWRLAAGQGDDMAQTLVGHAYWVGEGVPQSFTESVKWSRLAADQGDTTAQMNLGLAYRDGLGVEQDNLEALRWYEKAVAGAGDNGQIRDAANAEIARLKAPKPPKTPSAKPRRSEPPALQNSAQSTSSQSTSGSGGVGFMGAIAGALHQVNEGMAGASVPTATPSAPSSRTLTCPDWSPRLQRFLDSETDPTLRATLQRQKGGQERVVDMVARSGGLAQAKQLVRLQIQDDQSKGLARGVEYNQAVSDLLNDCR